MPDALGAIEPVKYSEYRFFEKLIYGHTNYVTLPVPKVFCSRVVAEMIKDKPYRVLEYHEDEVTFPLYLLILDNNQNAGKYGFVFYDDLHEFSEGKIVDFVMSQPRLELTEVQVRPTVGLEDTLKEANEPGLLGCSS